jgi:prophage regulatory protein
MKILRKPGLLAKVGLNYVTIWRHTREGNFPQPIQLGPNSVGWIEEEVDAWIASRRRGYLKLDEKPAA